VNKSYSSETSRTNLTLEKKRSKNSFKKGEVFIESLKPSGSSGTLQEKALSLMFNDGEFLCPAKNVYGRELINKSSFLSRVSRSETFEFISVNPLKEGSTRKDVNVSSFRNYVFEMDDVSLELQEEIVSKTGIPYSIATFSGNKSNHYVICLEEQLDKTIEDYKSTWIRISQLIDSKAILLGLKLEKGKKSFVDASTKNPSRFTRMPGGSRLSSKRAKGVEQKILEARERVSIQDFRKLLERCPKEIKTSKKVRKKRVLKENCSTFKASTLIF
jgi:hypothetical protein